MAGKNLGELAKEHFAPKRKFFILTPLYEAELRSILKTRGFELVKIKNDKGTKLLYVEGDKAQVNNILKPYGYSVMGFVWMGGIKYLFIGKRRPTIKKKSGWCKSSYFGYCSKCKLLQPLCVDPLRCGCGGKIHTHRGPSSKMHFKKFIEQTNCLKSIKA